ncbi:IS30 family transposase [Porphyromonas levii]|uniref:IS30 family transposase n=1 Tax=Porphyromonas levii TaxID=28114 RepID=A0A4Y8WPA0_9PORP|nr:IS30 family transposase [Porphyromonas levii]TFH94222.1 IS30 family transposase [Porphyromonas levii]TFH94754.1 IS30 family transposase [Porphyromonas levii]
MKYNHLTSEQRYTISQCLKRGVKQKEIADLIGVSPSTISREKKRHATKRGCYNHQYAQMIAEENIACSARNKATPSWIKGLALRKLVEEQWSPKQISGWLKEEKNITLSHETIYKWIRKDKKEWGNLYINCRHKLKKRKRDIYSSSKIPQRLSIHERPKEVDGKRFGDFEMDTIVSAGSKAILLTIVEKSTSMVFIEKLETGKKPKELAKAVVRLLFPFKKFVKSITTDNGTEFSEHSYIAKHLSTTVYFADPYSSWQKGAIENANKLIRQYIPKKMDFKNIEKEKVKQIQYKLNKRPREKINYKTPLIAFSEYFK